MITIVKNNVDDLKNMLVKHYFKDITKVEHIGYFNFIAYTPYSRIKIKSEPWDEDCNFINILSMEINIIDKAIPEEEQKILIYIARHNSKRVLEYLKSPVCTKKYSSEDLSNFESLLSKDITTMDAVNMYWDFDTAARDYFIKILVNVFNPTF